MARHSAPDFTITNGSIAKIKAQLLYKLPTGKFYLDDASLILTTTGGAVLEGAGGRVPLPAAP